MLSLSISVSQTFSSSSPLIKRYIEGVFVPPVQLWEINLERFKKQQPLIIPKVNSYEEDKEDLALIFKDGEATFRHRSDVFDRILTEMANPDREKDVIELCDMMNAARGGDEDLAAAANTDLGQWIADYLADNGYHPHINSLMIKQMILSAFPSVTCEKEYTPENLGDVLLRSIQVMNEYLQLQEKRKYSWSKLLGNGGKPTFYS